MSERIEKLLIRVSLGVISGIILAFIDPDFGWRAFTAFAIGVSAGVLGTLYKS